MSYIVVKRIKGREYRYLVRSVRDGPRVRQVFLAYLGPVGATSVTSQLPGGHVRTIELTRGRKPRILSIRTGEKIVRTPRGPRELLRNRHGRFVKKPRKYRWKNYGYKEDEQTLGPSRRGRYLSDEDRVGG